MENITINIIGVVGQWETFGGKPGRCPSCTHIAIWNLGSLSSSKILCLSSFPSQYYLHSQMNHTLCVTTVLMTWNTQFSLIDDLIRSLTALPALSGWVTCHFVITIMKDARYVFNKVLFGCTNHIVFIVLLFPVPNIQGALFLSCPMPIRNKVHKSHWSTWSLGGMLAKWVFSLEKVAKTTWGKRKGGKCGSSEVEKKD